MSLTRLVIQDFRNIKACDLSLSPGFNFLIGMNGCGKTSILEAIYHLGHGRSFRTHLTTRVIRDKQPALSVFGDISESDSSLSVGICKQKDSITKIKLGGEKGCKLVQLADVLPMQLIHPDGFELLTGAPSHRRAFIDWGVFHLEPQFFTAWVRLKRLTKQRNALLKQNISYQRLAPWDRELVSLAEQIDLWRKNYVENWVNHAKALCQVFLPGYKICFSYSRGWDKDTDYATLLQNSLERDLHLGYTQSGPHRADLRLRIEGIPVSDLLSRGQLKLLVCALRLAQGLQLAQDKGKQCIYLIDDFASELDSESRALLIEQLSRIKAQVFITAIDAKSVAQMCNQTSKMFHVEHGKIVTELDKRE